MALTNTSLDSSYYLLDYMEKCWAGALKKTPELQKVASEFLKAPAFYFQEKKPVFWIGTNTKDSKRYLLLSEETYLQSKQELEQSLDKELPTCEPSNGYSEICSVEFDGPSAYYNTLKQISKHNKKVKREERERRMAASLENARKTICLEKYMFFAIDVESYEMDHSYVTEVGWSMFNSAENVFQDKHYIIQENVTLRNGRYVADNKDRFIFGKSICTTLRNTVRSLMADWESGYPTILIGHDVENDVNYLKTIGAHIKPVDVFDTTDLYMAITSSQNKRKLSKILTEFGIDFHFLHNAGNDAHYTMEAFLAMAR